MIWLCSVHFAVGGVRLKGMVMSRSRRVVPLLIFLVIDGTAVEISSELKILGIIIDSKLTLGNQVIGIAASASRMRYYEKDDGCF